MNKKLYSVMNWPEIEGIVYAEASNPFSLLGSHLIKEGNLIQIFRPDAVAVAVKVDGKNYELEKVDEAGFFACLIPSKKKKLDYSVIIEDVKGKTISYKDAYSFDTFSKATVFKNFFAGMEYKANEIFSPKLTSIDGVEGCLFTVWVEDAIRVSVVADFNNWDGRIHQMEKIDDRGIFQLFIPGVTAGAKYLYEIKVRGQKVYRKFDPYAIEMSKKPEDCCIVREDKLEANIVKFKTKNSDAPIRIYELNLDAWSKKSEAKTYKYLANDIISYVKKVGYNYIDLMPIAHYLNDKTYGYTTVSMFAPSSRFGSPKDFLEFVNEFHKNGIGVIIDWNCAYFGTDARGLDKFNGTNIYGGLKPILEKDETWDVYTYDYYNNCVLSFLYSSLYYWIENFSIDGIRIDSLASMLYLDYGKEAGSWIPNIYGGNENLAAIDFIKKVNKIATKEGIITIADETSGWIGITKTFDGDNLGFDYLQNKNWTEEYLNFYEQDPLFRKGLYENLTFPMVYHFNEKFIQKFSSADLYGTGVSLYSLAAGKDDEEKKSDLRTALAYLYFYPGSKMIAFGQDLGLDMTNPAKKEAWELVDENGENYIKSLNGFLDKYADVFKNDNNEDSFEWLENNNATETVLSFARKSANGKILTVVFNFTPVERKAYRLFVCEEGKYKECFNSSLKEFGGNLAKTKTVYRSDREDEHPDARKFIDIDIPGFSAVCYECEAYTEEEIEENKILKEAAVAKKNAEDKAKIAKELATKAEEEARVALEAEKKAKQKADEAVRAKEEAERKAKEAIKASIRIDEETKLRLEKLRAKLNLKDDKSKKSISKRTKK